MIDLQTEYGISPAIGLILLIGISVGLATVTGVILTDFGDGLTNTVNAGVDVQESENGVEVSWKQEGTAEQIKVKVNNEEVATFRDVNDSITLGVQEKDNISIVGIDKNNNSSVIRDTEAENNTATGSNSYTVKESNIQTQTVTGSVQLNPDVENATVQVVEGEKVVNSTKTDSNGNFKVLGGKDKQLRVYVDGTVTYNGKEVYASTEEDVGEDLEVNVDFDESKLVDLDSERSVIPTTEIRTIEEFEAIKHDLDGNYKLIEDIDASETTRFSPVGSESAEFTGTFDGNGYTIDNLAIDTTNTNTGLFGKVGPSAEIGNLTITNASVTGGSNTGILAGQLFRSSTEQDITIANITVNGLVTSDQDYVGGVVGNARGVTFTDVTNNADVNARENAESEHVGGIVGFAKESTVSGVSNTGSVSGTIKVGGIAGQLYLDSSMNNSINTGDVDGRFEVGGVVGTASSINGELSELENTGSVTLNILEFESGGYRFAGGLVGKASSATVTNSQNSGSITSDSGRYTGGLIGTGNDLTVQTVSNTASITGTADEVGGLIGQLRGDSTLKDATNTGNIDIDGSGGAGVIYDMADETTLSNSYNTGDITVQNDEESNGGLVGSTDTGTTITESYNTGDLTATTSSDVGGLVGYASGTISQSYNTGNITGEYYVGGTVGTSNGSTLTNVYSTADITATAYAASFAGELDGNSVVQNAYSSGSVTIDPDRTPKAGFTNTLEDGTQLTNTYWNTDTAGEVTHFNDANPEELPSGLTTSEMQGSSASSNLSGFDFTDVWTTTDGFPELQE